MKIARFVDESWQVQYGVVEPSADGRAVRAEVIEGNIFGRFSPSGVVVGVKKLLAPVSPPNVIAIGLNYRDHAKESGMAIPEEPVIFLKATSSVVGPEDAIVLPAEAPDEVDYEAELVVVIGKECFEVSKEQALDYVYGYTIGNDMSSRDIEGENPLYLPQAKVFRHGCALGPAILIAREGVDPGNLAVKLHITRSGQTAFQGETHTSKIHRKLEELARYLGAYNDFPNGAFLLTGTGVVPPDDFTLQDGDVVSITIDGIGTLTNTVRQM